MVIQHTLHRLSSESSSLVRKRQISHFITIALIEIAVCVAALDPVASAVGAWVLAAVAANFYGVVGAIYYSSLVMAILCGVVFVVSNLAILRVRRIPWTQRIDI